ncbi:hypothetical protein DAPK24_024490 [Pichia kluyveri]|uniref:Uncharacterized protein n=1 Tax=Pichia kluyveri TaxID=36015 RepID=A0AAV5R5I9_PICKL|nr:hypothetical protein DAPK24_024490 [Pichia kluyveri]
MSEQVFEKKYVYTVLPPRTGLLRNSWYKRSNEWRPYPASCSIGLAFIAVSLFVLGLVLCHARGVQSPAILTGMFFFGNGLIQVIMGIWAIVDDNLFGSTLLLCYGGFIMSYGAAASDLFGVISAYPSTTNYSSAMTLFLSAWTVFDFFLFMSTWKSTIPLFVLTFCKWFFMLLLTIAISGNHGAVRVVSGIFCFITSICAFYAFYDGMQTTASSYLPINEPAWLRMPAGYKEPVDEDYIAVV